MKNRAMIDVRRSTVLVALTLAFLAGVWSGRAHDAHPAPIAPPTQQEQATAIDEAGDQDTVGELQTMDTDLIQEDDPRWDCHTMGNLICGPGQG